MVIWIDAPPVYSRVERLLVEWLRLDLDIDGETTLLGWRSLEPRYVDTQPGERAIVVKSHRTGRELLRGVVLTERDGPALVEIGPEIESGFGRFRRTSTPRLVTRHLSSPDHEP